MDGRRLDGRVVPRALAMGENTRHVSVTAIAFGPLRSPSNGEDAIAIRGPLLFASRRVVERLAIPVGAARNGAKDALRRARNQQRLAASTCDRREHSERVPRHVQRVNDSARSWQVPIIGA